MFRDDVCGHMSPEEAQRAFRERTYGKAKPNANATVIWPDVALQPGENRIEVTGLGSPGPAVTDFCVWGLVSP